MHPKGCNCQAGSFLCCILLVLHKFADWGLKIRRILHIGERANRNNKTFNRQHRLPLPDKVRLLAEKHGFWCLLTTHWVKDQNWTGVNKYDLFLDPFLLNHR